MNDKTIEQEIQSKGLTASRVTPADVEANIASEHYFTALEGFNRAGTWTGISDEQCQKSAQALSLLTFCVLVLRNGFTVTGESACASPENFDAELGRKIARQNAISKVWLLMGYELRSKLAAPPSIPLTPAEVESGLDRVHWAESLIKQLPADHEGRNGWLLNYGNCA